MKDIIVNPKATRAYVNGAIAGSKLYWYENAGHLVFIDEAERFNADLRELVRKTDGGA